MGLEKGSHIMTAADAKYAGAQPEVTAETIQRNSQRQLIVVMLTAGLLAGLTAYLYGLMLDSTLRALWKDLPAWVQTRVGDDLLVQQYGWVYTVVTAVTMGIAAGISIKYVGFPGDLPNVVECVHNLGYVPMVQTLPMILCSLCSIAAGGSLGPEAPLVAISAALCGWVSMNVFKHPPDLVKKFTLMGMSAGLSAFFGVILGGALFSLEVCHTMGLQFFEVAVHCVGAGCICLVIYRGLSHSDFGATWNFPPIPKSTYLNVLQGAALGALAVLIAMVFVRIHKVIRDLLSRVGLGNFEDTRFPVLLAAGGAFCISIIGILLPPTMFWSEFEMENLADPSVPLAHIWPQGGVWGLEPFRWDTCGMAALVGLAKLFAISITVHSGLRGGFIFPMYFAGASFGRAIAAIPWVQSIMPLPPVIACMAVSAGLNVVITRTPFASALILSTLSGQPNANTPVVASALTALFLTHNFQLIHSQQDRTDLAFRTSLAVQRPKSPGENHEPTSLAAFTWMRNVFSMVRRPSTASTMDMSGPGRKADDLRDMSPLVNRAPTSESAHRYMSMDRMNTAQMTINEDGAV